PIASYFTAAGAGKALLLSSRRPHTSCYRDWSSDVCSSDLGISLTSGRAGQQNLFADQKFWRTKFLDAYKKHIAFRTLDSFVGNRSEERRVGKECRTWWVEYAGREKATDAGLELVRCKSGRG